VGPHFESENGEEGRVTADPSTNMLRKLRLDLRKRKTSRNYGFNKTGLHTRRQKKYGFLAWNIFWPAKVQVRWYSLTRSLLKPLKQLFLFMEWSWESNIPWQTLKPCWIEGDNPSRYRKHYATNAKQSHEDSGRRVELCTEMRGKHLLETMFKSYGIWNKFPNFVLSTV
jgi:hypothetical protein